MNPIKEIESRKFSYHPDYLLRFKDSQRLKIHVIEHLFNFDEHWEHILGGDLICSAEQEHSQGVRGIHFNKLRKKYEDFISSTFLELTRSRADHLHTIRQVQTTKILCLSFVPVPPDNIWISAGIVIENPSSPKSRNPQIGDLRIKVVRKGKSPSYYIRTAYRPANTLNSRNLNSNKIWATWRATRSNSDELLDCPGFSEEER